MTGFPGAVVRLSPGSNPPATALAEYYELPMKDGRPVAAFSPRGMDVDRNGVVWTGTASGHLVSFDRRKCKAPLNGPKATGQHCAEGFTVYPLPGPNYQGSVASGQRRLAVLHVRRSLRHARHRQQQRADGDRE